MNLPFQQKCKVLDEMTDDLVRLEANVSYAALVDPQGNVLSEASQEDTRAEYWQKRLAVPAERAMVRPVGQDIVVVWPITSRGGLYWDKRLAGGVRLVLDCSQTREVLAGARRKIFITAALIALLGIPGGYVLIWHAVVRPIRQLVGVTRRLEEGDFSARNTHLRRDETGELGEAFNDMAERVGRMRDELLASNEQLEEKVCQRTAELAHTNELLREEMADKEQFLRAVSHDLNAPLRNIGGMATMIMMKHRDDLPEEVIARLGRIQSNVDAQGSLLDELLELSRIKSRPQKRQWVDFNQALAGVAEMLDYEITRRNITLHIDRDLPTLWVEPNRIVQVFQNLIDNAVKYMHRPEGGRIDVGYRRVGSLHEFRVADNGPGIAPAHQVEVFSIFRRADSAGQVEGKGVGLAVVRTIASKYEGRAWVESTPSEGTTFRVTFADHAVQPRPEQQEGNDEPKEQPVEAGHPVSG